MKSINKFFLFIMVVAGFTACENQPIEFPDFDHTAVYFPLQYPMRTLVLGEDRVDNTLDNELTFHIGVSIGGMYENTKDWNVRVEWAQELAANLENGSGGPIMALPAEHVSSITPVLPGDVVIPSGSFNGLLEVKLQESFLNDTLAFGNHYVLPLSIVESDADSILTGLPATTAPDKRVASDWDASSPPKDFTLFGIKFINPYHGKFLHRGKEVIKDATGATIAENVYSEKYITQDQVWTLTTTGRNSVTTNGIAGSFSDSGDLAMELVVDDSGNITIKPIDSAKYAVSGTGKYIPSAQSNEVWGDQKRVAMELSYSFADEDGNTHEVEDVLVMRDRGVAFEEISVQVVK